MAAVPMVISPVDVYSVDHCVVFVLAEVEALDERN